MIQLKQVSKRYGGIKAVHNLNLHIKKGDIFGFIGPNGAGKTTTIRLIAGLLAPSEGTVLIDNVNMKHEPVRAKKKIGLIPDRPFLYEKLTGFEFMRFTADLYECNQTSLENKIEELLTMFSLFDRGNELIESYSHGMKQRLIMSAALLHDPSIIIIDEPMVGLDPKAIILVKQLFKNLSQNGTTIFISTHTLTLAEDICDYIGIINNGMLIASGTLEELKQSTHSEHTNLEKVFLEICK